jgi:hypothetical protein
MGSAHAAQRNDKHREWALPRQNRRYGNAAKLLPDGLGDRHNAASAPGTRRRPSVIDSRRVPGRRDAEEGKPALTAIIAAIEEMREDLPRIGVGGLYLQFRCRGGRWALVTREDVRVALAEIECAARREFLPPDGTAHSRRPGGRTPYGSWPQFERAVDEVRERGADVAGIVRQLRERGWQRVGPDEVAVALRRIKAANAPLHFLPGRSLPAPRRPVPGVCPSCEVLITELGLCRCS